MRHVSVTLHAAQRYQQRARPDLTFREARQELVRLTKEAPAVEPPPWAGIPHLCLLVQPDVFVVCDRQPGRANRWTAKTVLTPPIAA